MTRMDDMPLKNIARGKCTHWINAFFEQQPSLYIYNVFHCLHSFILDVDICGGGKGTLTLIVLYHSDILS